MKLMVLKRFRKHLGLLRKSISMRMQDRMESKVAFMFLTTGIILRMLLIVVFFSAIYLHADTIAGWKLPEVYVLLGTYFLIDNMAWSTYLRGFARLPGYVRTGELDLLLTKPVNTKIYLSYFAIDIIFSIPNNIVAIGLIIYGANLNGEFNLLLFLFVLLCAFILHYSLTVIVFSVNFLKHVSGIRPLFSQLYGMGKYPIDIYSGALKTVFMFIIPLGLIFSFPARALVSGLEIREVLTLISVTLIFYLFSSFIWRYFMRFYKSAGG